MTGKSKDAGSRANKKKPAKPRPPPIVALTADIQMGRAVDAQRKAAIHLAEAMKLAAWGKAPNACVHSAYYAMHFTAVAALFRAGGVGRHKDVPKSHRIVIQHYAKLAETLPNPLRESGKELTRSLGMREESDYFGSVDHEEDLDGVGATETDAAALTVRAEQFVKNWDRYWLSKK